MEEILAMFKEMKVQGLIDHHSHEDPSHGIYHDMMIYESTQPQPTHTSTQAHPSTDIEEPR